MYLRCPNCKLELVLKDRQFICANNHQFDRAKSGYVNLLQSQKNNSKNHGDDLTMLKSRKSFLDGGYYLPLVEKMKSIIESDKHNSILDAGCGEGWYCQHIGGNIIGIDISKRGCDLSAKRNKDMTFAVASSFDLPILDQSLDLVYSVFAPFSGSELSRVLKDNGRFIQVYPLVPHLMGLKKSIYDEAYPNDVLDSNIDGFSIESSHEVHDIIKLDNNKAIKDLFSMTPYVHRTKTHELLRLDNLDSVETEIAFGIRVYRKN